MSRINCNDIVVSIRCTVYNHGLFLRDCLDGIVSQRTSFRFEAFVHDDASTDGSADIIREYAKQYPDIIIPYFESENQYSKKDGTFDIITYNRKFLRGKYIAICEGDDYWTDSEKLQKQVDYMEAHPDCSLCFGNAKEHWEDGSHVDKPFSTISNRNYRGDEICWNWIIPTASVLFRGDILESTLYRNVMTNNKMIVGDLPLFLTCAHFGALYAMSDFFSVYRRHGSGFTLNIDALRRQNMGAMWEEIPLVFGHKYKDVSFFNAVYHYRNGMRSALDTGNQAMYKSLKKRILTLYIRHPKSGIKRLLIIFRERRKHS